MQYKPTAAKAIGFLKSPVNDVEVYVEDTSTSRFWLALIKSCLPAGCKISSVTPLGGRDAVETACRLDQATSVRRRLYITDGDFDYLLGRGRKRLSHLHRIPAYCIEGLGFDRGRLLRLLCRLRPDFSLADAEVAFDSYFTAQWDPHLRMLFAVYATSFAAAGHEVTANYHVARLGNGAGGVFTPDGNAIKARRSAILVDIRLNPPIGTKTLRQIVGRSRSLALKRVVSGKTYLLVLTQRWLKSVAGVELPLEALFNMLLNEGSCVDARLRSRLRAA